MRILTRLGLALAAIVAGVPAAIATTLGGATLLSRWDDSDDIVRFMLAGMVTVAGLSSGVIASVATALLFARVTRVPRFTAVAVVAVIAGVALLPYLGYASLVNSCYLDAEVPLPIACGPN